MRALFAALAISLALAGCAASTPAPYWSDVAKAVAAQDKSQARSR